MTHPAYERADREGTDVYNNSYGAIAEYMGDCVRCQTEVREDTEYEYFRGDLICAECEFGYVRETLESHLKELEKIPPQYLSDEAKEDITAMVEFALKQKGFIEKFFNIQLKG